MLLVTPNRAALDLLLRIVEAEQRPGHERVFEAQMPIRITAEDLQRYLTGNGDLLRVGFWVTEEGVEAVAHPDPETPRSPFEGL